MSSKEILLNLLKESFIKRLDILEKKNVEEMDILTKSKKESQDLINSLESLVTKVEEKEKELARIEKEKKEKELAEKLKKEKEQEEKLRKQKEKEQKEKEKKEKEKLRKSMKPSITTSNLGGGRKTIGASSTMTPRADTNKLSRNTTAKPPTNFGRNTVGPGTLKKAKTLVKSKSTLKITGRKTITDSYGASNKNDRSKSTIKNDNNNIPLTRNTIGPSSVKKTLLKSKSTLNIQPQTVKTAGGALDDEAFSIQKPDIPIEVSEITQKYNEDIATELIMERIAELGEEKSFGSMMKNDKIYNCLASFLTLSDKFKMFSLSKSTFKDRAIAEVTNLKDNFFRMNHLSSEDELEKAYNEMKSVRY